MIERFSAPPVIWPRFVPAWMPAQNARARVAPTTCEVAATTLRDANRFQPDEALDMYSDARASARQGFSQRRPTSG